MGKSFADDIVRRRGLVKSDDEERTPTKNVVVVQSPAFFMKRDKENHPTREFSERVFQEFSLKFEDAHVIVCVDDPNEAWAKEHLSALEIFRVHFAEANQTTIRLRARLQDLGIRFKVTRNSRQMSFLNLDRFALDPYLSVGADDYLAMEIEPEKELTFQDMVAKRRRNSWP